VFSSDFAFGTYPLQDKLKADFLVFQNEGLGFEISHPADWVVDNPNPNVTVFYPPAVDTSEEFSHISTTFRSNPENKEIFEFYTGPQQRDLLDQSEGVFDTGTIDSRPFFDFSPVVTFTGERIIIITVEGGFLELVDYGGAFQGAAGIFDSMLSSLDFE